MDIENKFLVQGKVNKTYTREIEAKNSGKFTEYYVVIEIENFNTKIPVSVLCREPQNVNKGDEVEARGFLVSRYYEKTDSWFNTIRGKSLTVLKASVPSKLINAPLGGALGGFPVDEQSTAGIAVGSNEDVPF